MKNFDKKLLIIPFFLICILCIFIYFFTKEDNYDEISETNFYSTNETIETFTEIIIHIDGEILNPGVFHLPENSRIIDAIEASGGLTPEANLENINLAYALKDGQKIHIPNILDDNVDEYIETDAGENIIIDNPSSSSSCVNINTADQAALQTLPGIGASTAAKIIDYRNQNGNFKSIEDIMNVKGIGQSKFNNIKDFICV